jgi:hypothetical protein
MKKPTTMILAFLLTVVFLSCSKSENQVRIKDTSPGIATIGDSTFTLKRLNAILESSTDTLGRDEIEAYLHRWIEDQAFAQAALQASLLKDPRLQEQLHSTRLRFLRGLLEESWISEPSEPSKRSLKRFYNQHPELTTIANRQLKFSWYETADSLHLAKISDALHSERLRSEQLAVPDFEYGRTSFIEAGDLEPALADQLFALDYLDISELIKDGEQYLLYQVVGQRPAGYRLPYDTAEGLVRERYRQERQMEQLREKRKKLLESIDWQMNIEPIYSGRATVVLPKIDDLEGNGSTDQ